jgi:hypothetical protein
MDCAFSRIQFTADLLPSDVTGVAIYDDATKEFVFKRGPVFASVVLADEINRATPKTQSALLEVMDRGKVTVDGENLHTFLTPRIAQWGGDGQGEIIDEYPEPIKPLPYVAYGETDDDLFCSTTGLDASRL